jgi:hypothetical protein
MKIILFLLLSISTSSNLFAQSSGENRFGVFATYSLYDLWIPSKIGGHISYGNKKRTYELAYQYSNINFDLIVDDIGSVNDSRFHFSTRSFKYDNSFNYQYGISYNTFKANLGKSFVNVDLLEARTLSLFWGIGNRFKVNDNFEFGIDWLRIFWPVKTLYLNDDALDNVSNSDDREDLKDLIGFLEKFPTFTVLHFELGYRF